nr:unnamed protein product [Digitaria exilis]CAB3487624.1 unnamed protein product [Digitaria exilis]
MVRRPCYSLQFADGAGRAAYLVGRGGGSEQEVLWEVAAVNGRSARQEPMGEQERHADHGARRHPLPPSARCYLTHCLGLSLSPHAPSPGAMRSKQIEWSAGVPLKEEVDVD